MRYIIVLFLLGLNLIASGQNQLERFLQTHVKNKKICLVPNPGNPGDALILYGTCCLFDKMGINYIVSDKKMDILSSDIDVVMHGGGGNMVYGRHGFDFLHDYMHSGKQLVILPHTIREFRHGTTELLKRITKNVTIFCREAVTYNLCKKMVPYPENILISDDMAFYADLSVFSSKGSDKKNLFAFRVDSDIYSDRTKIELPESNEDISLSFGLMNSSSSLDYIWRLMEKWLNKIAEYEVIWTDRLHVGIAAFLLGKTVHLFDTKTHKVRGVYELTMRSLDKKNQVKFHGTDFGILNTLN